MTLANALPNDPKRIARVIVLAPEKCANFPAVRLAAWQKLMETKGKAVNVERLCEMQDQARPITRTEIAQRTLRSAHTNGFSAAALEAKQ